MYMGHRDHLLTVLRPGRRGCRHQMLWERSAAMLGL
jgi:hypothetical protein